MMAAWRQHLASVGRRLQNRAANDDGIALTMAILLTVILSIVIIAITSNALESLNESKRRTGRTVGLAPADSAISKYQFALQGLRAAEARSFVLDENTMREMAQTNPDIEVLRNNDQRMHVEYRQVDGVYRFDRTRPAGQRLVRSTTATIPAVTMVERYQRNGGNPNDALYGYWQVYRIETPNWYAPSSNLVVYFRSWVADRTGTPTTKARIVRVEFRPGRFADYQLLTDGPILFDVGAVVDGPVHTNGFKDALMHSAPGNTRVYSSGAVSCTANAFITTAQGTVNMPAACRRRENTGQYKNFMRTEESFARIQADCARREAGVYCFGVAPGGPGAEWLVELRGRSMRINGRSYAISPDHTAAMFDDDVRVSGQAIGRLTIAARRGTTSAGAANITLIGDTLSTNDDADTLGLMAQGHVVTHMTGGAGGCPVANVHAALIAATGGFTIPPVWTVDMSPTSGAPLPQCRSGVNMARGITIRGSVASHLSPAMSWSWSTGDWVGYTSRTYSFDPKFRKNTPPYFPITDAWQVSGWRDANADCLTRRRNDEGCQ